MSRGLSMALRLIQALYDSNSKLPVDDYKQILKEIQLFGVSSQVYYLLKERGKFEETPKYFQVQLQQNYEQALYLNLFIKKQQEQVMKQFDLAGINMIPLKGTVFAEKYFGHIGARGTSDIDLLINPKQFGKAVSCIKGLGFAAEEQIKDHFHCSYSKDIPGSKIPMTIELHWDVVKEKSSNFDIQEFWDHSTIMEGYSHVRELSDYHTFYTICLHGWRHNLDSPKYFIDILQVIYKLGGAIDYNRLLNEASTHKTLKRMVRTLSIVYEQFPHLNRICELPIKRENLHWDYRAFTDKNKRTVKKYIDFLDYYVMSYDTPIHLFKELLRK